MSVPIIKPVQGYSALHLGPAKRGLLRTLVAADTEGKARRMLALEGYRGLHPEKI